MDNKVLLNIIQLQTSGIEAYRRKNKLSAKETYNVVKKYKLSRFFEGRKHICIILKEPKGIHKSV